MPKAWLGVTLGRESTGFMKSHAWIFIAGARVLFVSLYAFVLWRNRGRVE
jgi:LPXTG-motif cell wall-anchored protein